MTDQYDLIVMGAGPAGSSAAITAARVGGRVLLLERGRFPRHKVCGEFVSSESLDLLRWLLSDEHEALLQGSLPLSESWLFLDGRSVRVPVKPIAASIARYDLDLALWKAAEKAGVTALDGTTVQGVEGEGPFRVSTSAGTFYGRAVINACGRWSNLRAADNGAKHTRWLGLKGHFFGDTNRSVDLYFFRRGYCGVQPVRAANGAILLNACALVHPDEATTLEEVLRVHPVLAARSASWAAAFNPVSTFPATFRDPVPVSGNVFNVGDAAGFVDPFVGDGISLALRGGHLAANKLSAFLYKGQSLQQSLETYFQAYRQSLRPVYRNSSVLRKFLQLPRGVRVAVLTACENSPRLARFLVKSTRARALELRYERHRGTPSAPLA